VDALHHLGGQLGQHLDRLHILLDLLHTRGPCDHRADARVLGTPGQRQLRKTRGSMWSV
jgi:hypothetical protein